MEFDFLEPLNDGILKFISSLSSQELGSKIVLHTEDQFPDISKINIAIIGVLEDRRNEDSINIVNLNAVRKKLYGMFPGNWDASVADLGDILAGNSVEDTYFALKRVTSTLIKNKVIPIVVGGSQDLTYALYRAYDDLEQRIAVLQEQEELNSMRPELDGAQIMEILNLKPGREVGEAYSFLLEIRLDEGEIGQEEAKKRLLTWWQQR